jgi:hypothetical protein
MKREKHEDYDIIVDDREDVRRNTHLLGMEGLYPFAHEAVSRDMKRWGRRRETWPSAPLPSRSFGSRPSPASKMPSMVFCARRLAPRFSGSFLSPSGFRYDPISASSPINLYTKKGPSHWDDPFS